MSQREVGIVTRADLAVSAANLDVIRRHVHTAIGNIRDVPAASRRAADELRVLTQQQAAHGGVSVRHRNLWRDHVESLRGEYQEIIDHLADLAGVAEKSPTRPDLMGVSGDIGKATERQRRMHALRARATQIRATLDSAMDVQFTAGPWSPWKPSRPAVGAVGHPAFDDNVNWAGRGRQAVQWQMPPAARFWFYGGSGTARGWAEDRVRAAAGRVGQARSMAQAMAAGYVLNQARRSIPLASGYAVDLLTTVSEFDLFVRDSAGRAKQAGDPWYSTTTVETRTVQTSRGPMQVRHEEIHPFKYAGAGVIALRGAMEGVGRDWMVTTAEGLRAVRGLGAEYTEDRLKASAKFARETGLDPGEAGGLYGQMLMHIAPGDERLDVLDNEPRPGLVRRNGESRQFQPSHPDLFGAGAATDVRDTSLLHSALSSMHWSAVGRSRPEMFMGDALAVASAMSPGQGRVHRAGPLGLTAVFHEIGMGGEAHRSTMLSAVRGTHAGAGPEDVITAARISAIRRHLPAVSLGAGEYRSQPDPRRVRHAMRAAQSGHPDVMLAYMRYAEEQSGGDDEIARDIFERMMGGQLSVTQTDRIWASRGRFGRWREAAEGDDPDRRRWIGGKWASPEAWREGPGFQGTRESGTFGSIGRHKAETDWTEHRLGRRLIYITENMRDAVVTAGDALAAGEKPLEALRLGADRLRADARAILGMSALAKGGKMGLAQAAYWFLSTGAAPSPPIPLDAPPQPARPRTAAPRIDEGTGLSGQMVAAMGQRHGVGQDAMVAAIVGYSEAARGDEAERRAIIQTLHNRVAEGYAPDLWGAAVGNYTTTGNQGGRPYATSRVPDGDAQAEAVASAIAVEQARVDGDDAGGVTHFMHPLAQAATRARALEHNRRITEEAEAMGMSPAPEDLVRVPASPDEVDRRRRAAGLERYVPEGTNADTVWFWRRRREP